ncbi:MAG TPA: Dam family site-specific DNA-(adenine-N6)-methyltransferase [Leptospiraceae bacterium]|nr:Dam family site-specific DNA-(adenine-N6)-methyltransferase [Leptospiraceae bacterium]
MKFLRYPGGKRKLLDFLDNYLPEKDKIEGKYIEPFVGGGSVYFHLKPKCSLISDLNTELIELYRGIKNYPKKVWDIFKVFPTGKKNYYLIRGEEIKSRPIYYRAARTLYLNRTCFKGMWRHNSEGMFNVGYGGEARRWVITYENILEVSKALKNTKIINSDFANIISQSKNGDFLFLDPPYKPGEREMFHAHYTHGKFTFDEQIRLAKLLKKISKEKNIKWIMTNSSNKEICKLYSRNFDILKIPKGTSEIVGVFKKSGNEVLIKNF